MRGKLINTGTAGRHDSLSREDALSIQGSNEDKYEMSRGQTFLAENRYCSPFYFHCTIMIMSKISTLKNRFMSIYSETN